MTWTYPGDMAETLIAAAHSDAALGRPWHAPSNPARSQQELIDDLADVAGVARRRVRPVPKALLWSLQPVVPILRPVVSLMYQYEAPFVMDDSAARAAFGIAPTPWAQMIGEVAADAHPLRVR
jgi:nucleoside-diphosphate-sugar epimerase